MLDEFLAQTLAYEQTNVPSLEGFLAWLVAGDTEVKRDTETLRDEVRVMTVHGAKGLEADIVFLIDNGTPPAITGLRRAHAAAGRRRTIRAIRVRFVWMRSVKAMPQAVQRTRDAEPRHATRRNIAGCSMSA